jgi:hypothetical protein
MEKLTINTAQFNELLTISKQFPSLFSEGRMNTLKKFFQLFGQLIPELEIYLHTGAGKDVINHDFEFRGGYARIVFSDNGYYSSIQITTEDGKYHLITENEDVTSWLENIK